MENYEVEASLVQPDEAWMEHIKKSTTPNSHKMFTDQSYHFSFWQNAEHSIILIDEHGNILAANPRFLNLTGTSFADLRDRSFFEMIDVRFFKRDLVNIEAIIDSKVYSYINKTQIKTKNKNKNLIPVKVVATRVPATLNHPFRHIVVHLYEMPDAVIVRNKEVQDMQPFEWKKLFLQPWFVKSAMWLIGLLAILISLSGQLQPIIHKLIEKL